MRSKQAYLNKHAKPAFGNVLINKGHPLASSLAGVWLFNEGAGSVTDLVSNSLATVVGTVGTWATGPYGVEFTGAGNSGAYFDTGGMRVANKVNATVLWFGKRAQGGGTEGIYCERASSGNDIWRFGHSGGISGVTFEHRDDAGTLNDINEAVAVDKYGLHGMTKTGTAVQLYQFALPVASGTLTGTDTFTNANHTVICNDFASPTIPFRGTIVFLYVWYRALSTQEITWINAEPYAFLCPKVSRARFKSSAAAVTSKSIPSFMLTGVGV